MRVMKAFFPVLLALVLASAAEAQTNPKIGYIDSKAILDQDPSARAAQQQFEASLATYQAEVQQMGNDLQQLIDQYEGKRPPSLDLFLDFVGLTEAEFLEISMSHQVSPYVHDPAKIEPGRILHDFDQWERKGKMDRKDAEAQLERWKKLHSKETPLT